jgi:hypothetical protein
MGVSSSWLAPVDEKRCDRAPGTLPEKRRGKQDRYCEDNKTNSARHKHNPELIAKLHFTLTAKR